jgi:peptidoglycan/xylan/chitin deacetylase (PgdA/CDA1 family)/glycosyltransferase involved in cell wall biosynthesis
MNILHVLSQFEVTGAETFAATLISEQILHGHNITVISDTFSTPVSARYIPMKIGKRDFPQRFNNIRSLKAIIKERKIQIVHTHSRAASWVCFYATRFTKVPLVSSVHGRQHIHFSSKTFKIYGEKLLPVCECLQEHMRADLKAIPDRIQLIRNGINLDYFKFNQKESTVKNLLGIKGDEKIITLIGRMSGPKGEVAKFIITEVFPKIIKDLPKASLLVVGGIKIEHDLETITAEINSRIGEKKIYLLGFQPNIVEYISAADLVIGSGRVAMEALAMRKPILAVGESNYIGVVSEENVQNALSTNFGDSGIKTELDSSIISNDALNLLKDIEKQKIVTEFGFNLVQREFDIKKTCKKVLRTYGNALAERKGLKTIPILIYHKIPSMPISNSKHGTYVTKNDFEWQLEWLKQKGFTTITFQDILDYRFGKKEPPPKPIMLTFDDGYKDNYTNAFPLLKKYNMTGVIFLVTNPAIKVNVWDIVNSEPAAPLLENREILEMAEYGIEFGSHTWSHIDLTKVTQDILIKELSESKKILENLLGKKVNSICYPYGAVNENIKKFAEEVGYEFGVATDSGSVNFNHDLYEIRRIQVFPQTGKIGFWKKTSKWYLKYKKFKKTVN